MQTIYTYVHTIANPNYIFNIWKVLRHSWTVSIRHIKRRHFFGLGRRGGFPKRFPEICRNFRVDILPIPELVVLNNRKFFMAVRRKKSRQICYCTSARNLSGTMYLHSFFKLTPSTVEKGLLCIRSASSSFRLVMWCILYLHEKQEKTMQCWAIGLDLTFKIWDWKLLLTQVLMQLP